MQLYLLAGFPGYAATSLADAQALFTALQDPATETNAATIDRVMDKIPPLMQADSGEPLVISSIDDAAGTISAWVTDAATTLSLGLGDPDANNASLYASTLGFTISGSTRLGTLALNTEALQRAVSSQYGRPPRPRDLPYTLQFKKSTGGLTLTVGYFKVQVLASVLNAAPVDLGTASYVTTAAARAGYLINLSGVTSLTGGGATTLDGQAAGGASFPVGCIVVTSDGDVGRSWRLKGTYLAATDLANGKIKPVNSDATLNPCYWQLIT